VQVNLIITLKVVQQDLFGNKGKAGKVVGNLCEKEMLAGLIRIGANNFCMHFDTC